MLTSIVPMALFAGALLVVLFRAEQAELQRALRETARAINLAVDREVQSSIRRLELLAQVPTLDADTLAQFHVEANMLLSKSDDWQNLLVFSANGEPLVNLRLPWGAPLPGPGDADYVRRVVDTRRPAVSGVFISPATMRYVVHVGVPVFRDNRLAFVLSASISRDGFEQILSDQAVRRDGIASILDRHHRFIARSRASDAFAGKLPIAPLLAALQREYEGSGTFPTHDGPEVRDAWARSRVTDWTVTFGIPVAHAQAALNRSLAMLAAAGTAVLLAVVLITLVLNRRFVDAMSEASKQAVALARGAEFPGLHATSISEIQSLGAALAESHQSLERESRQRVHVENERGALLAREKDARAEAETANRTKDDFLALLGHELRNPLAPILTAVELGKHRNNLNCPRELQVIERQAKHLVQLVDDLLDVSRIARGKVALTRRPINLDDVIAKAVEMAAPLLEARQHVLVVDVPERDLRVEGDDTRLAQVFANLLTNAAKYTPPQGRVEVTARRVGNRILVSVKDTGIGMSESFLPRIFDPFTQGPVGSDHPQAGLGLGLALVRSFVGLHGGTVSARSAGPDQGSEFIVELPVCEPDVVAEEAPSATKDAPWRLH